MYASMINPFSLEKDNKSFYMGIQDGSIQANLSLVDSSKNRIRNMNEELKELARKKEEMLFKESQMNYIFSKQKPSVSIGSYVDSSKQEKDKKFRVRDMLKQKKQSLHEYLNKKKEIYIAKMNINIKKEETIKMANEIREQQETLKSRKLYFENDVEFMKKFIDNIKKQTQDAQSALEEQMKHSEILNSRLNYLDAENQKLDLFILKDQQYLQLLQKYQEFIEQLYNPDRGWKPYVPGHLRKYKEVLFMTEKDADVSNLGEQQMSFVIKYSPANLIELFLEGEEVNYREIHNLQNQQHELDTATKDYTKAKMQFEQMQNTYLSRIQKLEEDIEKKSQKGKILTEAQTKRKKIEIIDNEHVDIDKLKQKLTKIYSAIEEQKQERGSRDVGFKQMMTDIQVNISDMRLQIQNLKDSNPKLIQQVDSEYKKKVKRQNQEKKREEFQQEQLRKKIEQEKRKNVSHHEKPKGRKIMEKYLFDSGEKKKKKIVVVRKDEDAEYFEEQEQNS